MGSITFIPCGFVISKLQHFHPPSNLQILVFSPAQSQRNKSDAGEWRRGIWGFCGLFPPGPETPEGSGDFAPGVPQAQERCPEIPTGGHRPGTPRGGSKILFILFFKNFCGVFWGGVYLKCSNFGSEPAGCCCRLSGIVSVQKNVSRNDANSRLK